MAASKRRSGFTLIEIIRFWSSSASLPRWPCRNIMICRRNTKERPPSQAWLKHSRRTAPFRAIGTPGEFVRRGGEGGFGPSETADAAEGKNGGYRFGDFLLAVDGGALTSAGSAASAKRVDSTGDFEDTGAKLYLPQCGESTNHSFGSSTDMDAIIKAMREAGVSRLDSGAAIQRVPQHSSDVMAAR